MRARKRTADPARADAGTEQLLYAHHFWLAPASLDMEHGALTNELALAFVGNQAKALGRDPVAMLDAPRVDRRSKHTLYPDNGAPAWQDLETLAGAQAFCWVYQIDDVTGTMAAIRATSAGPNWFAEAESFTLEAEFGSNLLGACYCRVVRGGSGADLKPILDATFGAEPFLTRSVVTLAPERTLTLYQGVREGSERIELLAVLPLETDSDDIASDILNRVIPDFARLLFKISVVARNWESGIRPDAMAVEQALARTDVGFGRSAVEDRLERLVGVHHRMAQDVASLRHHCQSASTNLANLMRLRASLLLGEKSWFQAGIDAARVAVEQLQSDLEYFLARLHESEVKILACRVSSDLERARAQEAESGAVNRRSSLIAIAALVLAAVQIVDEKTTVALVSALAGPEATAGLGAIPMLAAKLGLIAILVIGPGVIAPQLWKLLTRICRPALGGLSGRRLPRTGSGVELHIDDAKLGDHDWDP